MIPLSVLLEWGVSIMINAHCLPSMHELDHWNDPCFVTKAMRKR